MIDWEILAKNTFIFHLQMKSFQDLLVFLLINLIIKKK